MESCKENSLDEMIKEFLDIYKEAKRQFKIADFYNKRLKEKSKENSKENSK